MIYSVAMTESYRTVADITLDDSEFKAFWWHCQWYTHVYDKTLLLEGSACSCKQDAFLDLYIRVVDDKFVTGIHHEVDDFNFEVINCSFLQSNINHILSYTTFYSQLIRFFRLCNNINDFQFLAKFSYSKLVKRGYMHSLLFKYLKYSVWPTKYMKNMARKINPDLLFLLCFALLWLCNRS